MSKASVKQILKAISTVQDNLPKEEIENLDVEITQKIIDNPVRSGKEFMKFLRNGARVQIIGNVIDCDAASFVPKGWSVEEHRKGGQFAWDPGKVSLYLSESQKNGSVISGNKLRKELQDKPVLNANVLDYLLEHPELIPEEWKGKYIFFWGTIYRGSDGGLYVRCLSWDGERWSWGDRWLGRGWNADNPAAVAAGA